MSDGLRLGSVWASTITACADPYPVMEPTSVTSIARILPLVTQERLAMTKRKNGIRAKVAGWLTPVRLVGLAVSLFGHLYRTGFASGAVQAFYANISTECISIAMTVILIDWLYERRD